jgi:hypothetical protein
MGELGGATPPLSHMTLWLVLGQLDLHVMYVAYHCYSRGLERHFMLALWDFFKKVYIKEMCPM